MDKLTKKNVGKRLNEVLAQKNIMQKELAKHIGVTDNTVSYYLSGERCPDIEKLIEIAKFLNVSTDYLLGASNVKTTNTELKSICEYTGLSEAAVNRLHWITNHINGKEITEIISSLIVPDGNARFMNDLTFISGALYCYGKGYTELIEKMRSVYSSLNDLPIEKVREISVSFEKERKQTKTDYYDVFELFKKLVDDYIETHINTPEKYAVYKDFWQAISNREEET